MFLGAGALRVLSQHPCQSSKEGMILLEALVELERFNSSCWSSEGIAIASLKSQVFSMVCFVVDLPSRLGGSCLVLNVSLDRS